MTSSELRISLKDLKDKGELPVDATAGADLFPDALSEGALVGPVAVEGVIRAVDDTAAFAGTAKGRWSFECALCLAPVEGEWSAAVELEAPIEGGSMDLSDEVRQAIALAQPMKVFCKPDCRGLCPVCRKDLNKADCGHRADVPAPQGRIRLTRRPDKG